MEAMLCYADGTLKSAYDDVVYSQKVVKKGDGVVYSAL